jgi:glycosyltransferase involved in cell wall biosynthesis
VAHSLRLPLVASWHTNLHEYLARRLDKLFDFVPCALRTRITHSAEAQALRGLLRFYRMARFTFAPSQPLVDLLHENTRRAAFLMHHGVDLNEFRPSPKRAQAGQQFCIGYVGRLTTEKNVRHFAEIDRALRTSGEQNYKFLIVGDGGQRNWLKSRVGSLEMTGVLRGEDLVGAYNRMDAFVFPSQTDTFGLVVLEAMASGIPVLVAPKTGACVGVQDGVSGFVSEDFVAGLRRLMHDRPLCHAMGCAARQFAAAHGWDVVFEDLYGTYAHALSSIQPVSAS